MSAVWRTKGGGGGVSEPDALTYRTTPGGGLVVLETTLNNLFLLGADLTVKQILKVCESLEKNVVFDVAVVSCQEVIVSCGEKIQFVDMKPQMRRGHYIEMGKTCYGIAYQDNKIYVATNDYSLNYSAIIVVNRAGETLQVISNILGKKWRGNEFYQSFLSVDLNGQMYISVSDTGSRYGFTEYPVFCLLPDGHVAYESSFDTKVSKSSITVDDNQNVYVFESSSLLVIYAGGRFKSQKILELPFQAVSMAYRVSDKTIFVLSKTDLAAVKIR